MDRSIDEYDQSLVDLERQKEQLELLMKKMGQEWEQSGAGIGWLHTLQETPQRRDEPRINTRAPVSEPQDDMMALASPITPDTAPLGDHNPFFPNQPDPSSQYLESLLNAGGLVASTPTPPMTPGDDPGAAHFNS
ncbi:hypothetical protein DM01DRAFT_1405640 [Hesseltinella vesiculosa]|uniref:Uncharacterized protein n=1 Tax=Hesseltinella vesiculosa TaxID=101127 RepID=A0A1X2GNP0_9FUNG|nr:hypothetical protein DM01DRAFT_1405640 [Hesseltinella vesiculosa]